jgi:drug/metabolite transporter (DMT)-like permease
MKLQGAGMFAAAVIWGTWVLVLSNVTLPGFFVTAITSATGFLGLLFVVLIRGQKQSFMDVLSSKTLRKYILVVAFLEAFQNALFMVAFTLAIEGGGSVLIPIIRSFVGIITPLLAIYISKHEKFSSKYLLYGTISTIGAILIFTWGGIQIGNQISFLALGLVVLSVAVMGIQNITMRSMAIQMKEAGQNEMNVITYQAMFSAIFLSPLIACYLFLNPSVVGVGFAPAVAYIGIFGLTHVALAFVLRLNALKHITAQQAVIIGYLEQVVSISLSILFLGEQLTAGLMIGATLIIGSAMKAGLYSVERE